MKLRHMSASSLFVTRQTCGFQPQRGHVNRIIEAIDKRAAPCSQGELYCYKVGPTAQSRNLVLTQKVQQSMLSHKC
ncbi:hypothetical protein NQZ68_007779 [Dissostichus eleginoides]|nr:hypothetical protein NQZ68_007779 [Dissostichus eleginoides]